MQSYGANGTGCLYLLGADKVELDQSAENVIAAVEAATQDYPPDER